MKPIRNTFKFTLRILLIVLTFSACFPLQAHNNPAYSHDAGSSASPSWMVRIKDAVRLTEISLPGTHDSMSLFGGETAQTQSMSLDSQLNSGIRALDIRVRKAGDAFAIHHGPIYQKAMFGGVLNSVNSFLNKNPSEFIVMNVQKEGGEGNSDEIAKIMKSYLTKSGYRNLFWKNQGETNPKISSIRGKIVLIRHGVGVPDSYGIAWQEPEHYFQNDWEIKGTYAGGLYKKWEKVRSALAWMNNFKTTPPLGINFFSASGVGDGNGMSPFHVASGHSDPRTGAPRMSSGHTNAEKGVFPDFPRLDCLGKWCSIFMEGINTLAYDRVGLGNDYDRHLGILFMDFPGGELIKRIISTNFHFDFGYKEFSQFADVNGDGKADYCREVGDESRFIRCDLTTSKGFANAFSARRIDLGYVGSRILVDVTGDGKSDYCRLVGDHPVFIRCEIATGTGFSGAILGKIDLGYHSLRAFADVNGDGKADYCREVGNHPNTFIRCEYATAQGFKGGFSAKGLDMGYTSLRSFTDVNGDGKADYCREVGDHPSTFIRCEYSTGDGFKGAFSAKGIDMGYAARLRKFADVNGDGKADYCREVGNEKRLLRCELSTGAGFKGAISKKTDMGYLEQRQFVDIDGATSVKGGGKITMDYCRKVGDQYNFYFRCEISDGSGFPRSVWLP